MNKSMLAGIGIGVAAALGVAAVASMNVFDRGPQYAQVISATPIKETVKNPRQECRNVTLTHRKPVQDEHKILGTVVGAALGGVLGNQFGDHLVERSPAVGLEVPFLGDHVREERVELGGIGDQAGSAGEPFLGAQCSSRSRSAMLQALVGASVQPRPMVSFVQANR